jgi:hypothetical protein
MFQEIVKKVIKESNAQPILLRTTLNLLKNGFFSSTTSLGVLSVMILATSVPLSVEVSAFLALWRIKILA